jgi:uncharacterized membrane protein YhaH (DUF805 family)
MEDIQKAVKTCFNKYGDFNGRAARPEFWWFMLALTVVHIILSAILPLVGGVFALAVLVPSFSAGARRLHDTGKTGWLQLLWLIPFLGWAIMIYLLAQPGEPAANRWGNPPDDAPMAPAVAPGQQ